MLLVIDNYDSFTYNLVHLVADLPEMRGRTYEVLRNDAVGVADVDAMDPEAVLLSPGPCTPNEAGICVPLVQALAGRTPILGVCLGHQAIGQAFGGSIVRAPSLQHGKTSPIFHEGRGLMEGVANGFIAARYHSLTIDPSSVPAVLEVQAWTDDVIMAVGHRDFPIFGVQFHPESIASEHGRVIMANFLRIADAFNDRRRVRDSAA